MQNIVQLPGDLDRLLEERQGLVRLLDLPIHDAGDVERVAQGQLIGLLAGQSERLQGFVECKVRIRALHQQPGIKRARVCLAGRVGQCLVEAAGGAGLVQPLINQPGLQAAEGEYAAAGGAALLVARLGCGAQQLMTEYQRLGHPPG